jgi:hypothetical protein
MWGHKENKIKTAWHQKMSDGISVPMYCKMEHRNVADLKMFDVSKFDMKHNVQKEAQRRPYQRAWVL